MGQMIRLSLAQSKRLFMLVSLTIILLLLLAYFWLLPGRFDSYASLKQRRIDASPLASPHHPILMNSSMTGDKAQSSGDGVKCVHPALDPYNPLIMQHYARQPPVDCSSAMKDWVYVTNGTFRISQDAINRHGEITCEYSPIFRQGDFDVRYGTPVKPMLDGMPLQSDFFHVSCVSKKGTKYQNIIAAVAWNNAIMNRLREYHSAAKCLAHQEQNSASPLKTSLMPNGGTDSGNPFLNLSIFLLGFDSMSRMGWHRNLPKSHKYFTKSLGAIELENYNILGRGTASALLPMLTGQKKEELPEARPGYKGAKTVDDYPWIWKEFSQRGYVTTFSQDRPTIGAFHYMMRGFKDQPTDHSIRTFYIAAEKARIKHPPMCWGSKPGHANFMNWFRSLLDMYKEFPKFFHGHYVDMSHDHMNRIQAVDDDLLVFLHELEHKGHLNSTLMILLGDHGPKFFFMRQTSQGYLEARLPYFALRFPPWFHKLYPKLIQNINTNTKRLTTPLDIHATFKDMINHSYIEKGDIHDRAISLFREIPKERTCTHAVITLHWCTCLEWEPVNATHPLVRQAVHTVLREINAYTKPYRNKCSLLTLQEITKSVRYVPSPQDVATERKWLKFKNRNAPAPKEIIRYQVTFKTLPGEGHFEATLELRVRAKLFSVQEDEISRINRYGSQPACIQQQKPNLSPYCYCIKGVSRRNGKIQSSGTLSKRGNA